MAAAMDAFAPGTGQGAGYQRFQAEARRLHEISEKFFFWKSVEGITDTMDMRANFNPDTMRDVMALRMGQTVAKVIRGHVPDARLAQMLDHFCQYVGSNPYQAPAVLCSIGDMQTTEGVWYPVGGTRAVAEGLAKLTAELGGDLRPNTEVTGFEIENGAVKAVRTASSERIACDAVISNMDAIRTYKELVGGDPGRKYAKKGYEPACSGVVLYLGSTSATSTWRITASSSPAMRRRSSTRSTSAASRRPDPTAYLAAPSGTDPTWRRGGEALYVLVHTPCSVPGHDWRSMFAPYRQTILDKLKRTAGMEDIESASSTERR
jgi:phytoene dehydrogenase-like protein